MPREDEPLPPLPANIPKAITDILLPDLQTRLTEEDLKLLGKPILGKNSYAQTLYERFKGDTETLTGGSRLRITVVAKTSDLGEIAPIQAHEGKNLLFNDELAGSYLEIYHKENLGVFMFMLVYGQEPSTELRLLLLEDGSLFVHGIIKDQIITRRAIGPHQLNFSELARVLAEAEVDHEALEGS